MARPQSSPILAQLRSAKTYPEQTAALQALKNEIVGHVQKKEEWISVGVLEPIVRSLTPSRNSPKANGKDAQPTASSRPLSDQNHVKLQALQLISSFATGGAAFLPPLHAAMVLPAILNHISPSSTPTPIMLAALRALTNIADAALLAPPSCSLNIEAIANHVFIPQHIESIILILASSSSPTTGKNVTTLKQNTLTVGIISRLCHEERHQQALTAYGVLDLLATQLASVAVRDGLVVPGAADLAAKDGLYRAFPTAAKKNIRVGPILEAISAILGDSKYRATRLVNSPSILAVFPPVEARRTSRSGLYRSQDSEGAGVELSRPKWLTAMEYLLPAVILPQTRNCLLTPNSHNEFAELRSSRKNTSSASTTNSSRFHVPGHNGSYPTSEIESPFIPWLVLLVRSLGDDERLMALSVVASLFRAGLCMSVARETTLALLVVPILVNSIEKYDKENRERKEGEDVDEARALTRHYVLERAPVILARLITDCEFLQKAAFDCDAVRILPRLLVSTFKPLPPMQPGCWSEERTDDVKAEDGSQVYRLGEPSVHPLIAHRVRVREAALKAIGAIASFKEDYRKALVVEGLVPFVVASLTEYPGKPQQAKAYRDKEKAEAASRSGPDSDYGTNPISVIVAACFVVRMLSRSVHTLRTVIIDCGVAEPILSAMQHPNINLQIAATATVANLVVTVSPSKEYLTEHGVMKVLCEHAHSYNPALRLNALWALKHFVDGVSLKLKKTCLEQLEPGWLVRIISDKDEELDTLGSKAGDDVDEDMEGEGAAGSWRWIYPADGSIHVIDSNESNRLGQMEDYLTGLRESENSPLPKARNDDIAIQEQGIEFIRNLIGRVDMGQGANAFNENTEVIEYLFKAIGEDRLFGILGSKLRTKVLHGFSRRGSAAATATAAGGERESRVVHPQTRIVASVIYILAHVAAACPHYCEVVIGQTELLKLLTPHTCNQDREVRLALCRLMFNLTWTEECEGEEAQAGAQRAAELRRLGFHTRIERLVQQDRDLDVRERAKTAAWQMNNTKG